jgi:hypothetical protein
MLSKTMSFRTPAGYSINSASRCSGSLCRQIRFSPPPWRIPAIIEAWFFSSEKMTSPGISLASVESAASFAT